MSSARSLVWDRSSSWGMAIRSLNVPQPRAGEVVVAIRCAALNPVDYKLNKIPVYGWTVNGKGVSLDFSGIVAAVGANVTGLAVGDEVVGHHWGACAEKLCVPQTSVVRKPNNVSFVDAAAMMTTGLTGLQGLRRDGHLQPGHRVLVIGASGGCGTIAVQIAKALGAAHVVGVCSSKNKDLALKLGCDAVFAYDDPANAGQMLPTATTDEERFDVIYDSVTSPDDPNFEPVGKPLLKPNGRYIALNGGSMKWVQLGLSLATRINMQSANYCLVAVSTNQDDLTTLMQFAAEGKISVVVEEVLKFTEDAVRSGYDKLRSRRVRGKLVVDISGDLTQ